jgi:hypothetical protein
MSTYVFVFRAPRDFTPGDPDAMSAWTSWFKGISDHVVELGNPVFTRRHVGVDAPSDTVLGGYSLISAASLEEAVGLTEGCPALEYGGAIEVGELAELPPEATEGIRTVAGSTA